MQPQPGSSNTARASDIPDDVRADLDAEERRQRGDAAPPVVPAELPEDVLGERDLEARKGSSQVEQVLVDGGPPVEGERTT
jgi:hypothetical protein